MKALKFLFKAALLVVAVVVVLLLAMPLWFGPVVKGVANAAVPKVTKTDFRLDHLSLNPYTARFEMGGMTLSNPEGYSEKVAAKVGALTLDAKTTSLVSDVIHIEEITLKDVFVSYVDGGKDDVNNFLQIQYNVAGGKEKYEKAQAAKELKAEVESLKAQEAQETKATEEKAAEEKPAKKLIIDRLLISGVKIKLGLIPLSVPVDISLTDIGKESDGATFEEVCQKVWESILKAAGAVGDQFKAVGGFVGDATKQATGAVGDVTKQATDAVGDAAKQATDAVSDVTKQATGAVGDAAKQATDAAGKALDSIKKLW